MILYLVKGYLDLAATTLADAQALLTALANPALASNQAIIDKVTGKLETLVQSDSGEPLTISSIDDTAGSYSAWVTDAQTTLAVGLGLPNTSTLDTYASTTSFSITGNTRTGTLALNSRELSNGLLRGGLRLQIRTTNSAGAAETRALLRINVVPGVLESPVGDRDVDYTSYVEVAALATAAAASAAAATTAETNAETAETNAETAQAAAAISAAAALVSENAASASASTATTQAGTATTQAGTATTQAGIATTQAGLATTAKTAAETAETNAETAETNAAASATAAGVSAAAALVSEAAALVSKNAAAASAATASAVSGSGNGTFSAAALTGVNSVTASASTALTLTGGSTGASLVLGNTNTGASLGGGGLAVGSSASFVVGATAGVSTNAVGVPQISASSNTYSSIGSIAHNTTNGNHGFFVAGKSRGTKASPTILADGDTFGEYSFAAYDGAAYRTSASIQAIISGTPGAGDLPTRLAFSVAADGSGSATERATLTSTGNLLIGTTTDAASLAGGLVVNGSGAGATASSTVTGALRVTGGVGVSGAGYFGGAVQSRAAAASFVAANYDYTGDYGLASTVGSLIGSNSTSASLRIAVLGSDATSDPFVNFLTSGATNWVVGVDNSDSDAFVISRSNAPGATNILRADSTTVSIPGTTSASSSTVGALTIGNGSALTNVAIGSGIIHAGRDIRSGASGTLQGVVTVYSGDTASAEGNIAGRSGGGLLLNTNGNNYPIALNGSAVSLAPSPTASASVSVPGTLSASSSIAGAFLVGNGTAATNVAIGGGNINAGGTLTVAGTVIHTLSATPASASATGTVGTMSWDANYIYICTATNTWKRVAIATW